MVGPPRTATTWLHDELNALCNLPLYKETHFFDEEFQRGLGWYFSQFKPSKGQRGGEICPTYFYDDAARQRMARLVPHAKIICCFREPVSRLYSLYKLKRADAYHNYTFREAVEQDPEMLLSARYAYYLQRWIDTFGQRRVLTLFIQDLQHDPLAYLQKVCRFLGLEIPQRVKNGKVHSSEEMSLPRNYSIAHWFNRHRLPALMRWGKSMGAKKLLAARGNRFEQPEQEYAGCLREFLCPEIERLERLTGRDLSEWKPRSKSESGPYSVSNRERAAIKSRDTEDLAA